jgi:hypothetical protein
MLKHMAPADFDTFKRLVDARVEWMKERETQYQTQQRQSQDARSNYSGGRGRGYGGGGRVPPGFSAGRVMGRGSMYSAYNPNQSNH